MKKIVAVVMAIALVSTLFAVMTSADEGVIPSDYIAYFSFDDTDTGLSGGGAVATAYTYDDDGNKVETTAVINSDVASQDDDDFPGSTGCLELLDDSSDYSVYWLEVTKEDGTSLLTDVETLTVSFWVNTDGASTCWAFFAVPSDDDGEPLVQTYLSEKYLGVLLNGSISVERYYLDSASSRTTSITSGLTYGDDWQMVTIVYDETGMTLYQDGAYWAEADLSDVDGIDLPTILGEASHLLIGTATWTSVGTENFWGYLDEYYIWDYAFSEDDVAALYAAYYTEDETEDTTEADTTADDGTETEDAESTAADTEDAATTAGDSTAAETEEDTSSSSGCGSALGAAAVIVAVTAVFGCAVVKKK
ncbi:MAG: LamG domain-containing protein [Clostridiales bacterium]|nr:LamG domain-containing protein [Clostridiales bacterium]